MSKNFIVEPYVLESNAFWAAFATLFLPTDNDFESDPRTAFFAAAPLAWIPTADTAPTPVRAEVKEAAVVAVDSVTSINPTKAFAPCWFHSSYADAAFWIVGRSLFSYIRMYACLKLAYSSPIK